MLSAQTQINQDVAASPANVIGAPNCLPVHNSGDMSPAPPSDFGFGLSYKQFEYSKLQMSLKSKGPAGPIEVSIEVRHVGQREGSKVVQLYLNDVIASAASPIKELKNF